MARGVKKSLQEKITQKEELIDALSTRIKKERDELNELLELQKMEELNELREVQAGAMAGCGPECGVSIGGQF